MTGTLAAIADSLELPAGGPAGPVGISWPGTDFAGWLAASRAGKPAHSGQEQRPERVRRAGETPWARLHRFPVRWWHYPAAPSSRSGCRTPSKQPPGSVTTALR